jgi:hypothetical protein
MPIKRRHERDRRCPGLDREHVDGRARDMPPTAQASASASISTTVPRDALIRIAPRFIRASCGRTDHVLRGRRFRHVQGHDVGTFQQVIQPAAAARIAERQLGLDVVIDHRMPSAFGQHADLRADVAVADDAEHLAAHLKTARRGLRPAAAMALRVLLRNAAHQQHGLGNHQLGHAAGVGERRVEYRNAQAVLAAARSIWLVPMQNAPMAIQSLRACVEHALGQLRARADADEVRFGDARLQLVLFQRFGVKLDIGVARLLEGLHCALADAFQQQHADVLTRKRGFLAHGGGNDGGTGRRLCQIESHGCGDATRVGQTVI